MKTILVPVGSSKNAQSHLQYAVDFAKAFGAKLYVVQISKLHETNKPDDAVRILMVFRLT